MSYDTGTNSDMRLSALSEGSLNARNRLNKLNNPQVRRQVRSMAALGAIRNTETRE